MTNNNIIKEQMKRFKDIRTESFEDDGRAANFINMLHFFNSVMDTRIPVKEQEAMIGNLYKYMQKLLGLNEVEH